MKLFLFAQLEQSKNNVPPEMGVRKKSLLDAAWRGARLAGAHRAFPLFGKIC
jgi:hypothetical protein